MQKSPWSVFRKPWFSHTFSVFRQHQNYRKCMKNWDFEWIEANCALKISIFGYFVFFLELTLIKSWRIVSDGDGSYDPILRWWQMKPEKTTTTRNKHATHVYTSFLKPATRSKEWKHATCVTSRHDPSPSFNPISQPTSRENFLFPFTTGQPESQVDYIYFPWPVITALFSLNPRPDFR